MYDSPIKSRDNPFFTRTAVAPLWHFWQPLTLGPGSGENRILIPPMHPWIANHHLVVCFAPPWTPLVKAHFPRFPTPDQSVQSVQSSNAQSSCLHGCGFRRILNMWAPLLQFHLFPLISFHALRSFASLFEFGLRLPAGRILRGGGRENREWLLFSFGTRQIFAFSFGSGLKLVDASLTLSFLVFFSLSVFCYFCFNVNKK